MSALETQSTPTSQDAAPARPRWQALVIRPEAMTLILLIIGIFAGAQLSPYFLDITYILRSFSLYAEVAMVALVLTMVIIAGEIDLSPAANMALSACIFAWLQQAGVPIPAAVAIGLASGVAMGAVNAIFTINDPSAIGADLAAKQLNRTGIVITTVDGSPDIEAALKGNTMIEASSAQLPSALAAAAVKAGVSLLKGEKLAEPSILVAPELITRENVGSYKGWNSAQ